MMDGVSAARRVIAVAVCVSAAAGCGGAGVKAPSGQAGGADHQHHPQGHVGSLDRAGRAGRADGHHLGGQLTGAVGRGPDGHAGHLLDDHPRAQRPTGWSVIGGVVAVGVVTGGQGDAERAGQAMGALDVTTRSHSDVVVFSQDSGPTSGHQVITINGAHAEALVVGGLRPR